MSLDRLEFYEALVRVAELLSEELPFEADLQQKKANDVIEYEAVLNKEARISGLGAAAAAAPAPAGSLATAPQSRRRRRKSADESSDSGSDDEVAAAEVAPAGGDNLAAELKRATRAQQVVSRTLEERVEMLLRVVGAKLGMRHQGQLQSGKQLFKFVPRYIADAKSLSLAV
jgi:hypothetical protein